MFVTLLFDLMFEVVARVLLDWLFELVDPLNAWFATRMRDACMIVSMLARVIELFVG